MRMRRTVGSGCIRIHRCSIWICLSSIEGFSENSIEIEEKTIPLNEAKVSMRAHLVWEHFNFTVLVIMSFPCIFSVRVDLSSAFRMRLLSDNIQEESKRDNFESIGEGMDPLMIHRKVEDRIDQHRC